jgi:hypothetical protein
MSVMARRLGLIPWLLALLLCGCSQETEYKVGQTIEMGPFAFVIEDAYERVSSYNTGDPKIEILVDLRLDAATGAKVKFDEFLNDTAGQRGMIIYPHMEIRDQDGRKFLGMVHRVSGRERWQAEFPLVDDGPSTARQYVNRRAADFRLIIKNPDRREGQPSRVKIALG